MSRSSFCLLLCWSFFSGAPQVTAKESASVETLTIEGAKKSLLSDEKDVWGEVPDYVAGATILRPENGNDGGWQQVIVDSDR